MATTLEDLGIVFRKPTAEPLPGTKIGKKGPRKLKISHVAIMDWLLTHPSASGKDCADHFGVSAQWIYILTNSDAFQALLKEKQAELFVQTVVPLRQQVIGAARQAVDKLGDAIEQADPTVDKQFIHETTHELLKQLDFGSSGASLPPGAQVNNYFTAGPDDLARARKAMSFIKNKEEDTNGKTPAVEDGPTSELSCSGDDKGSSIIEGTSTVLKTVETDKESKSGN